MDAFYYLAHCALRSRLLRDTGFLEELLADPAKQQEWLHAAALETATLCGLKPEHRHAEILSTFCQVFPHEIAGRPALIVDTPEAQKATHCHYVAAFRGADGALRYYTLEHSHSAGEAALCGWSSDGTHSLYEFVPLPQGMTYQQIAAFTDAIEKIERRRQAVELRPPLV